MQDIDELLGEAESLKSGADYYELAKLIANGDSADAELIARACTCADKNVEDFRQLVLTIQSRQVQRDQLTRLEEIELEKSFIRSRIDEENEHLERAVQQHDSACQPLQSQLQTLELERRQLAAIPADLVARCPNEMLKRRMRVLDVEANRLQNETQSLKNSIPFNHGSNADAIDRATKLWEASQDRQLAVSLEMDSLREAMIQY